LLLLSRESFLEEPGILRGEKRLSMLLYLLMLKFLGWCCCCCFSGVMKELGFYISSLIFYAVFW
jgi:hypothetical protein